MSAARRAASPSSQLPSGRHGLSREFVHAHQQERLLRAVSRACAARGYLQTTVADIVREARVSRRVFYSNYAGKEECFLAAFSSLLDRLERRVVRACSAAGPHWQDRANGALEALLGFLAEQPDTAHTLFVAVMSAGPRALRLRLRALRRYGRRLPLPEGAPPELAESLMGAVVEVVYEATLEDRVQELPSKHRELLYSVLLPLVGDQAASEALERTSALTKSSS